MERFGDYLKVHREKKGIRLEEIASITKIHLRSLELLEASQWNELPPEPFIRGFIIAYAKYVGIDTKEVLERYFAETGQKAATATQPAHSDPLPQPPSQLASDVIEHGRPLPSGAIFAGAGVALVFALIIGVVYIGKKTSTTEAPVAAAVVQTAKSDADERIVASPGTKAPEPAANVEAKPPVVAAETKPPTPPAADPEAKAAHEVVIEAHDRTWARVTIDDQPPQRMHLREGEKVTYTANTKLKVVLGDGSNSKVFHNGKLVYGFKAGETLRAYRFPNSARFPQDNAARREAAARSEDAKSDGEGVATEKSSDEVTSPGG